jgi:hypothetical protein
MPQRALRADKASSECGATTVAAPHKTRCNSLNVIAGELSVKRPDKGRSERSAYHLPTMKNVVDTETMRFGILCTKIYEN